ncbi:MAG: hypothetical protein WAM78_00630 [Candidatus Sulfotelmatobacter sp.]
MFQIFKGKPVKPKELADQAQRILSGECRRWDVDSYENRNPKDPKLKELHSATFHFGLPERWAGLDDAQKNRLRGLIEEMRGLASNGS